MTEETVHRQICQYLKAQYPNVVFITDASGVRMSPGLAKKFSGLKSDKGIPDLIIFEKRDLYERSDGYMSGTYSGLMIELKADRSKLFKKNGDFKKSKHIDKQRATHEKLRAKGYKVEFACGFDEAKEIIDNYLAEKSNSA